MNNRYDDLIKGLTSREVRILVARLGTKAPSDTADGDLDVDPDRLKALARRLVILKKKDKKKE
jgi:hypothetical protein